MPQHRQVTILVAKDVRAVICRLADHTHRSFAATACQLLAEAVGLVEPELSLLAHELAHARGVYDVA